MSLTSNSSWDEFRIIEDYLNKGFQKDLKINVESTGNQWFLSCFVFSFSVKSCTSLRAAAGIPHELVDLLEGLFLDVVLGDLDLSCVSLVLVDSDAALGVLGISWIT